MSNYRRPWWLVVNKSATLITTVNEETTPGERIFAVRGEPYLQGLAWLTWGPVCALGVIIVLTGLVINLNLKEAENGSLRLLFTVLFLTLPALAWGGAILFFARLSTKHLQAEREAEADECVIRLRPKEGKLLYRRRTTPETTLTYSEIEQARVAPAPGGKSMRLILVTQDGPLTLLDERLGSRAQKIELAYQIQEALKAAKDAGSRRP